MDDASIVLLLVPGALWLIAASLYSRHAVWLLLLWIPIQGWVQLNIFNDSNATVLLYEVQVVGIYLIFTIRALREPKRYGPPQTMWFAVPVILWALALVPFGVATNGPLVTALGIRTLLLPLPLVWIGYRAFENQWQLRNVGKLVMLQLVLIAWVTAAQYAEVSGGITSFGWLANVPLGFTNVGIIRPPGTFSSAGHLGMYVLFAVPFAIGLLGLRSTRRTRVMYAIGLVSATVALMVNTQRATIVLLTVTLPFAFWLARTRHAMRNILVVFCVLGAGGAIGSQIAGEAFVQRVLSISTDARRSLIIVPTQRMMDALRNPLIGEGVGVASPGARRLVAPLGTANTNPATSIRESESFMAALVYEMGVPGLLLFYLFIAALMIVGLRSVRECRRTDMALLAATILIFEVAICLQSWTYGPLHLPPSRVLFWFWAGVLLRLPALSADRDSLIARTAKRTPDLPGRRLARPRVLAAARRSTV